MIVSFGDKTTEDLFNRKDTRRVRRLPPDILRRALRRLVELGAAESLIDVAVVPGNCLEKLVGKLTGFYSIRVNEQWRIIFQWIDGHAHGASLTDYHG